MMTRHATRGFTLIELLVVVAIIGLLLGLVVPIMGRTKGLARSAVCASNLRALQTGITQYMMEHRFRRDKILGGNWVADTHWGVWWGDMGRENIAQGQIWEFVRNYDAYLCPSFERICRQPPPGAEARPGIGYGQAYLAGGVDVPAFSPSSFTPVRSYGQSAYVACDKPGFNDASAVWLCDVSPWRDLGRDPSFGISSAELSADDTPGEYHAGKANCSFKDGHVAPLSPAEILQSLGTSSLGKERP